MNTKKLDKLRDKVYGILLIHINMKRSTELKPIIRNILNNTNDENTIINLGYINLIINHDKILTERQSKEYSDLCLCMILVILMLSKKDKYSKYTLRGLIDLFCSDYEYKDNLYSIADQFFSDLSNIPDNHEFTLKNYKEE